jgi:hypothetical protein
MALPDDAIPGDTARHNRISPLDNVEQRLTVLERSVDLTAMRPAWETLVRSGSVQHIGLLGGNLVVERFALFRFTRRYPELVGLTPVVRRVNDDVTVVIADPVGVGGLARIQGVARAPSSGRSEVSTRLAWGSPLSLAIATRFPSAVDG